MLSSIETVVLYSYLYEYIYEYIYQISSQSEKADLAHVEL